MSAADLYKVIIEVKGETMDVRLFRYLLKNTSSAVVMSGCTWDKGAQEQVRYAYTCEMVHNSAGKSQQSRFEQSSCSSPLNLFIMGSFSVEDAQRLIDTIRCGSVNTVILPYVVPIQRFLILKTLVSKEIMDKDLLDFIQTPYLYLKKTAVKKIFFIYGNGSLFDKTECGMYPGNYFEFQDKETLDMIEEMEGYRIPVMKAGYIIDNRTLFYFGHYGADLPMIRQFISRYARTLRLEKIDEREIQKMMLVYQKVFADSRLDTLTVFCSPTEITASQTDCVFHAIVVDKEDLCHTDIEMDEGRCSVKCMLYNDYDVCHCHRTQEAELRAGILLLGNVKLRKYLKEIRERYKIVEQQIRAVTIPNCGNIQNWDKELTELDVGKNAVFWICPLHTQMPDQVMREIKSKNARYRIIGLNDDYGCCFNGFLTEKTE